MALRNLGNSQLTTAQLTAVKAALSTLEQGLSPITVSLEGDDRQKYGSVNEQNKLLINRVADFRGSQPALSSPRVDWAEFQADFNMRKELENIENRLQALHNKVANAKILHDYDNYQAALEDYNYTSYSMNTNASDYEEKHRVLKQFFPRTGTGGNSDGPTKNDPTQ